MYCGERAPFPHERLRRSPSSAVRPFCLAHPHNTCFAFDTRFRSNPTSLRQFADPEFAGYEQRWNGRSVSCHGEVLRTGEFSFPISRRLEYCHHDIGGAVHELPRPSEHTSTPSGDNAAPRRTLELSADTRGASDAREAVLGRRGERRSLDACVRSWAPLQAAGQRITATTKGIFLVS
jgi:hypothetical protein